MRAKHGSLRLMNINQNRRVYTSMIPVHVVEYRWKILHIVNIEIGKYFLTARFKNKNSMNFCNWYILYIFTFSYVILVTLNYVILICYIKYSHRFSENRIFPFHKMIISSIDHQININNKNKIIIQSRTNRNRNKNRQSKELNIFFFIKIYSKFATMKYKIKEKKMIFSLSYIY